MYRVELSGETDFEGWREAARQLCAAGIAPNAVLWQTPGGADDLFGATAAGIPRPERTVRAPKAFVSLARKAVAHRDPQRFSRLYTLLDRLQSAPRLLDAAGDADVAWLTACDKAVRRDIHKMHAFVRFRAAGTGPDGRERFAAWFEPEHRIVELATPFFQRRFPNMDWLIVTPEASAAWDGETLAFGPGGTREDVPEQDALEDCWTTYFRAIFNPARLKVKAMTAEMPKKYWRNMPEAAAIPDLIASAEARQRTMQESGVREANPRTDKWRRAAPGDRPATDSRAALHQQIEACRACPLHGPATQPVFGEGPETARLMIVGEQPGDREDLEGRVFIGPAGALLDAAFAEAGIDRAGVYLTNAVKHFKFERRGKRRLHARPSAREIDACHPWLAAERARVAPRVILALGASAARSVLGPGARLADLRRRVVEQDGAAVIVTVHPAYLLRLPDRARAEAERTAFIADLARAAALVRGGT